MLAVTDLNILWAGWSTEAGLLLSRNTTPWLTTIRGQMVMSLVPGQRQVGAPARKWCPKFRYQLIPGLAQHWALPCEVRQTRVPLLILVWSRRLLQTQGHGQCPVAATVCPLHSRASIKLRLFMFRLNSSFQVLCYIGLVSSCVLLWVTQLSAVTKPR